jgi:hypothetical protein
VALLAFYDYNQSECEARWRAAGNKEWLIDEDCYIVEGFAYTVLLDSDSDKRFALDNGLIGKTVKRDDDGKLFVVNNITKFDLGDGENTDLPDDISKYFDFGPSDIGDL